MYFMGVLHYYSEVGREMEDSGTDAVPDQLKQNVDNNMEEIEISKIKTADNSFTESDRSEHQNASHVDGAAAESDNTPGIICFYF